MQPTILIVEDEAPLVELLKYNVEALGYDVHVAMRGDEAETPLQERLSI
jgi:two-component system phosphate regulon response regulator PhoB